MIAKLKAAYAAVVLYVASLVQRVKDAIAGARASLDD